jgi:hypothetical protein
MNDLRFITLFTLGSAIWVVVAPELWLDRFTILLLSFACGFIISLFTKDKK